MISAKLARHTSSARNTKAVSRAAAGWKVPDPFRPRFCIWSKEATIRRIMDSEVQVGLQLAILTANADMTNLSRVQQLAQSHRARRQTWRRRLVSRRDRGDPAHRR
jgi:hypothetical protein